MSVVPGLGHFYKGHTVMAAAMFIGAVVACMAVGVAATATMGLAVMLLPLYWCAVMMHVYWLEDLGVKRMTGKAASKPA
jgi:hypothetical protein